MSVETKEPERDELEGLPPRDLLRISDEVLNNPILMAIVDSGHTPKDCYGYILSLGWSKDTAHLVKAAVKAKLDFAAELDRGRPVNKRDPELASRVWSILNKTSIRPSASLDFPKPIPGELVASRGVRFGSEFCDRKHWPLLMCELQRCPDRQDHRTEAPMLTTFDFDGSGGVKSYNRHSDDDDFMWHFGYHDDHYVSGTVESWKYKLCPGNSPLLWLEQGQGLSGRITIHSTNMLIRPWEPGEQFPAAYKMIEYRTWVPQSGDELVRIMVRLDFGPNSGAPIQWRLGTIVYSRRVPVGKFMEMKFETKYSISRNLSVQWLHSRRQALVGTYFNEAEMAREGASINREAFSRSAMFYSEVDREAVNRELLQLAERFVRSRNPTMEELAGRMFLRHPPENLSDLFTQK